MSLSDFIGTNSFFELENCIWRTDMARMHPKGAIFSCSLCGYIPKDNVWFKNDFYNHYLAHFEEYAQHLGTNRYDGFILNHDFYEFTRKNSIIKQFRAISKD